MNHVSIGENAHIRLLSLTCTKRSGTSGLLKGTTSRAKLCLGLLQSAIPFRVFRTLQDEDD